jgi:nucleotide-binding universal stress UspA family protein
VSERFVVVVGVDGSEASTLVIETASQIAKAVPGSELHLVNVLELVEATMSAPVPTATEVLEASRERLEQLRRVAAKTFGGRVVGHLATGEPWREIVQFAERLAANLIVVGSQNLTGLRRLALGSVSEHVVRKAKCPVLVVRKTDYHTRDVPEIEPACPDCLIKQRETAGESLWCARHTYEAPAHLPEPAPHWFGMGATKR